MRDPAVSRYAASRLSPRRREADLMRLRSGRFDVLVIGGGVTGAGAALDAVSRGLSVALVEASDLAGGTSSRSSKLIHGGLRYLEQWEFGLVREALRERRLLANRLAPHLVRPVPFLVPLSGGGTRPGPAGRAWRRAYYGTGVAIYDVLTSLGPGRGMPPHRHLTRSGARRIFPSLREDALTGAIRYYDGQVDDARLVVTVARTAASMGAALVTGARAVGLLRHAGEVVGARVRDTEARHDSPEAEFDVRARTVIAATGVWSNDTSALLGDVPGARPRHGLQVRASKGVHLVVPRSAITGDAGLILRTETSVLFVIPWGGHWIIGTTDTDWTLDRDHPVASARDIEYLLAQVNRVLDRPLSGSDIEGVYAGLRPLLSGEDDLTSKLSREHAVVEPMLGLMVVAGGKYTTYRVMAQDVVDLAVHRLSGSGVAASPAGLPASCTADLPLLGADGFTAMWRDRADMARRHGIPVGVLEHLLERYGTLATEVLAVVRAQPELAVPVSGAPEYLAAEVVYAARAEAARHLDDVLSRRTRIFIETAHRGEESATHAAALMGLVLGWDTSTRTREVDRYLTEVTAERRSEQMPDDLAALAARNSATASAVTTADRA